jgi:hypothetical protein
VKTELRQCGIGFVRGEIGDNELGQTFSELTQPSFEYASFQKRWKLPYHGRSIRAA